VTSTFQVLVVSHTTHLWGAEQRLLDTASRLRPTGIELVLAAPPGAALAQAWTDAGLAAVAFNRPQPGGLRRTDGSDRRPSLAALGRDGAASWRSAQIIARLVPSARVIASHSLTANLEVGLAARMSRRRAVLDLHDIVRPGLGRQVLAATVALAGATIANSASTAATIPRPLRHRVAVIHPGVDTNRFSPGPPVPSVRRTLAGDSDEPVVAIVGRVDPDKGVDIVVDAVARLNNSGLPVRLAVVGATAFGHDDWRVALGEMAEARLGDRAVFTDVRHDIPDVLRSADILVNASYNEPFGRSVLEAQACGTPVIGTDAGGGPLPASPDSSHNTFQRGGARRGCWRAVPKARGASIAS
jgi:starch synthase